MLHQPVVSPPSFVLVRAAPVRSNNHIPSPLLTCFETEFVDPSRLNENIYMYVIFKYPYIILLFTQCAIIADVNMRTNSNLNINEVGVGRGRIQLLFDFYLPNTYEFFLILLIPKTALNRRERQRKSGTHPFPSSGNLTGGVWQGPEMRHTVEHNCS